MKRKLVDPVCDFSETNTRRNLADDNKLTIRFLTRKTNMKRVKTTIIALAVCIFALALTSLPASADTRPNILIFYVDDLGSVSYTHLTLPTIYSV